MSLTIIPRDDNFCFFKRMDDNPEFVDKSKRLLRDKIGNQIEMFAQEIVSRGFAANRLQVEDHIRRELYDKIKVLVTRFLAKHPYRNIEAACFANGQAIRNLISREIPRFGPFLSQERVAVPAAAGSAPCSLDGQDESASESDSDAEITRQILESHLAKLVERRKELRAKLNSLKLEEDKLAHIMANLLDQPREVEQNHKKRKAPMGQTEIKPVRREFLNREDLISRLEKAIRRNDTLIEKLKADISEKRRANKLEHQKVAIIVQRRNLAEPAVVQEIVKEEISEPVSHEAQSCSIDSDTPTRQESEPQYSPEILKLVPRSVLLARRKGGF